MENTDHIVQRPLCKTWISSGTARIALGGFMGTGKSTIGDRLSKRLGVSFMDMDTELERRFGPITTQFEMDGEQIFRSRETTLLRQLISSSTGVVATGGGVWVQPQNRPLLEQHFVCVVLTAPWDTLVERVGQGNRRPLWGSSARTLYTRRKSAYEWGDIRIQTDNKTIDDVVEEIFLCIQP